MLSLSLARENGFERYQGAPLRWQKKHIFSQKMFTFSLFGFYSSKKQYWNREMITLWTARKKMDSDLIPVYTVKPNKRSVVGLHKSFYIITRTFEEMPKFWNKLCYFCGYSLEVVIKYVLSPAHTRTTFTLELVLSR